jgi:hypothetical protein
VDAEALIAQAERLQGLAEALTDEREPAGVKAQVCEFLRLYAGPKTAFYKAATEAGGWGHEQGNTLAAVLDNLIAFVRAGLHAEVSPERRAQLDVVSDFFWQAHALLDEKGIHPAAPAVLAGAALEEFLRTWVEAEGLSLGSRKPSIDAYAGLLREGELISKQDVKDITSWAGLRNHAAHGQWEEVADKNRIAIMVEGISLFMRRYDKR